MGHFVVFMTTTGIPVLATTIVELGLYLGGALSTLAVKLGFVGLVGMVRLFAELISSAGVVLAGKLGATGGLSGDVVSSSKSIIHDSVCCNR